MFRSHWVKGSKAIFIIVSSIILCPAIECLKQKWITHIFSHFQIRKNMPVYCFIILFQSRYFGYVQKGLCWVEFFENLNLFIVVDPLLVIECILSWMQVNEQVGLFCFNGFIKADGKGLVDGFVTGVDFRFWMCIIRVKLSGKISV